ncbi:hypothetical protein LTR70_005336 [Exophiala xenobiotica]|uniref:Uncharacterized protein n=1 Tax=Lithohypha guttulata TaxID=1690604 RepID=A0ABR0K5B1_9EURO|nr:hypothetical protein LTR24_006666 [Lithohypha guttulata]KAK5318771.1 hypothetical protein LTR70_005336 [Exophiala xenobiotica]
MENDMTEGSKVRQQSPRVSAMAVTSTLTPQPSNQFRSLPLRPAHETSDVQCATLSLPLSASPSTNATRKRPAATALEQSESKTTKKSHAETPSQVATSTDNPNLEPNGQPFPSLHPFLEVLSLYEVAVKTSSLPGGALTFALATNAQIHICQEGIEGDKTPEDVLHHFATNSYPARSIDGVLIMVEVNIVTNETGRVASIARTYMAERCKSIAELKKAAKADWPQHFRECGIKMPQYDPMRITIHVAQSHGPSLKTATMGWDQVIMQSQYWDWFQKNVIHGRAPAVRALLTYDVEEPLVADDLFN